LKHPECRLSEGRFETDRVLREAPRWAVAHGLVPAHFEALVAAAHSLDPNRRPWAQEQLAGIYAALGLYERAEAIDRRLLETDPQSVSAARRLVWSHLHQRRVTESLAAAAELAAVAAPGDTLSRMLIDAAQLHATLPEADAAALVAALPVFTRSQGQQLFAGFREPEARLRDR
jgi:tetratricopeptide (TPR) repeat protein